jgi:hypothetical protein
MTLQQSFVEHAVRALYVFWGQIFTRVAYVGGGTAMENVVRIAAVVIIVQVLRYVAA